ncbi:MAG TPA: DUF2391 family protein [Bacteriovoracaceae bacterium]|nr:DUF2391 family protein [Bacteriovoracaceae bacterium]
MLNWLTGKFKSDQDPHGFGQEFDDLMRGISGGLIFGMPLLYTMEVWYESLLFPSGVLMALFFFALILNVLFSYFAGLRENHSAKRLLYAVDDGVTSIGLSVVLAFLILWALNQIELSGNLRDTVAKVILEASVFSIGVTFTNYKFKKRAQSKQVRGPLESWKLLQTPEKKQLNKDLGDLLAASTGAFVYSFNVAPTEEILVIAASVSPLNLCLIVGMELVVCYIVLYASGLRNHVSFDEGSFFQKPLNEVLLTVSISVLVSVVLVRTIGFGELQFTDPNFIPAVVILGFPAVVGGAAGRLVV